MFFINKNLPSFFYLINSIIYFKNKNTFDQINIDNKNIFFINFINKF